MIDNERIRVLLVDDDEAALVLTRAILEKIPSSEFELDWVPTPAEGSAQIRRRAHDVYLIDYQLGETSGIELVRDARAALNRAPMILLTGKGRYEVDLEAMEAGVSDYLDKTKVDPELMERSIRYALDRVESEEALRESEARHRSMFDHLPIGLYRTALDGQLLDANPALARILGNPSRDAMEFDYARNFFVSPGHRQALLTRLDQFGVVRGFESALTRPDGSPVWVRTAARAHRDDRGAIAYIEGAVEDVSEEHEARDLHGRAARFDWVFTGSGMAILLLDLQGTVRGANPAFQKVFGYVRHEMVGRPLADFAAEDDAEAAREELARLASGMDDVSEAQRLLKAADGEVLWARTRTGLVRNAKGHPDHLMMLLEDVAER